MIFNKLSQFYKIHKFEKQKQKQYKYENKDENKINISISIRLSNILEYI